MLHGKSGKLIDFGYLHILRNHSLYLVHLPMFPGYRERGKEEAASPEDTRANSSKWFKVENGQRSQQGIDINAKFMCGVIQGDVVISSRQGLFNMLTSV